MTDIDFDELDRAVNSTFESNEDSTDTAESVMVRRPEVSTTEVAGSRERIPSPAVRRSSGRFMDVVHPSSDMRGSSPVPVSRPYVKESVKTEDVAPESWQDSSTDMETEEKEELSSEGYSNNEKTIKPLESPFLTDAKVEKRPLGAFSGETQQPEPDSPVVAEEVDTNEGEHPIETDTPMPAELHEELLSIEGSESETPAETPSIPQQYVEKPVEVDKTTVPIYNTDAYHQPLAHPKKDKSGWLMVLWIFMLLVVGAGAGAAVYFYVLPMI